MNQTEKTEKYHRSPTTLQVRREDILYREDIKTTFGYGIIVLAVTAGALSLGYLIIKQLRKD